MDYGISLICYDDTYTLTDVDSLILSMDISISEKTTKKCKGFVSLSGSDSRGCYVIVNSLDYHLKFYLIDKWDLEKLKIGGCYLELQDSVEFDNYTIHNFDIIFI